MSGARYRAGKGPALVARVLLSGLLSYAIAIAAGAQGLPDESYAMASGEQCGSPHGPAVRVRMNDADIAVGTAESDAHANLLLLDVREAAARLDRPARAKQVWPILEKAETAIADIHTRPESERVRASLHLARSLARLSRVTEGEVARAARLRAAELYLEVSNGDAPARSRLWAEGELAGLYLDAGREAEALVLSRRAFTGVSGIGDPLGEYVIGRTLAEALDASGDRSGALDVMRRAARLGEELRRDRLGQGPARLASPAKRGASAGVPSPAKRGASAGVPSPAKRGAVAGFGFELDARATTGRLLAMLLDRVEREGADASQDRLREVRDLLETQRSAELEDHFGDACLAKDDDVAIDAIEGALVLYPILLDDRVALLTGFEGRFAYHRAPITTRALLDHARSFRRLLEKRTTREFLRPAQHLYDALIRPIESRIESDEVDTLVVVPDGLLRTIPFAAFHDRDRSRYLIDLKAVALVPSLRLTRPTPIADRKLSILAAGIEKARGGFSRLDYTRQEIDGLRDRFPSTRVLFDESFEIAALEKEITTRPYSIVHLATHGRVAADGRDSFLLAYDGRLGLDRMASLISRTRFRRETPLELLTLSACETASGDEAAALGLAGVALRAGARSALATLWPVNDEAAARLIDRFYEALSQPGQSRAGALREAQRAIRDRPRFAHPGYWAPFLMISSWL